MTDRKEGSCYLLKGDTRFMRVVIVDRFVVCFTVGLAFNYVGVLFWPCSYLVEAFGVRARLSCFMCGCNVFYM